MVRSPAFARIKSDVLAIVKAIPKGHVATAADIGRVIDVPARHVAFILTTLDDAERAGAPWWRVVADGGAIGRHKRREDQIAALTRDGVTVSAAGVVIDFVTRRTEDFVAPPSGMTRRPADTGGGGAEAPQPARRARASKGAPKSTV